jgi:hypothetical protein
VEDVPLSESFLSLSFFISFSFQNIFFVFSISCLMDTTRFFAKISPLTKNKIVYFFFFNFFLRLGDSCRCCRAFISPPVGGLCAILNLPLPLYTMGKTKNKFRIMCREPGRKESKNEFLKKFALRVLKKKEKGNERGDPYTHTMLLRR